MPRFTLVQPALLEVGAAALLGGADLGVVWRYPGLGVAVVTVVLALVPVQRRWLYQLATSWFGLARRRRRVSRAPGLAGLLGSYSIEAVNGGSTGAPIGVVRSGTTWCLPLVLALDGVFNDDPAVPVQVLSSLLQIEDVPLSSVRLFTMTTPAQVPSDAPAGPSAPLSPLAARVLPAHAGHPACGRRRRGSGRQSGRRPPDPAALCRARRAGLRRVGATGAPHWAARPSRAFSRPGSGRRALAKGDAASGLSSPGATFGSAVRGRPPSR